MFGVGEAPEKTSDKRFVREEYGGVFYEFLMSNKKAPRYCKVFLPKIVNNCRYEVKPELKSEGIVQ